MKRKNPFRTGTIVTDEGYIGRNEVFKEITDSILMSEVRSPNYSLRGLTRMGKTSLACKIINYINNQENENIITVFYSLANNRSFKEFMFGLVHSVYKAYKKTKYFNENIQDQYESFKYWVDAGDNTTATLFLKESLFSFFEAIDETGAKTVIFIDEFDNAIVAFEDEATNFQVFRNIIIGEYKVSCVLTNRLPIKEIEKSLPTGSTLGGVINERKIIGFTKDEMELYFEEIKRCGVDLNDQQKTAIIQYGGNSPFILSLLAHGILNVDDSVPDDDINIDDIFNTSKLDIRRYFNSLVDYMKQENLYSPMIQMFIGPKSTITKEDINKLLEFGYIYHDKKREEEFIDPVTGEKLLYQTLCADFIEYLRNTLESIEDDTWRSIISTEQCLRKIIEDNLIKIYSPEDWQVKLREDARPKRLFCVNQADRFLNNSKKNFPDTFNGNILSVISIQSLSNIINVFWKTYFRKIFNPPYEKEKLTDELMFLNSIRNPLAHGSGDCLSTNDHRLVKIYCKKIQDTIKNKL